MGKWRYFASLTIERPSDCPKTNFRDRDMDSIKQKTNSARNTIKRVKPKRVKRTHINRCTKSLHTFEDYKSLNNSNISNHNNKRTDDLKTKSSTKSSINLSNIIKTVSSADYQPSKYNPVQKKFLSILQNNGIESYWKFIPVELAAKINGLKENDEIGLHNTPIPIIIVPRLSTDKLSPENQIKLRTFRSAYKSKNVYFNDTMHSQLTTIKRRTVRKKLDCKCCSSAFVKSGDIVQPNRPADEITVKTPIASPEHELNIRESTFSSKKSLPPNMNPYARLKMAKKVYARTSEFPIRSISDDPYDNVEPVEEEENLNTKLLRKKSKRKRRVFTFTRRRVFYCNRGEKKNLNVSVPLDEYLKDGVIDGRLYGNVSRFFNHSCDPNLFPQHVFVDTHNKNFPWLSLFALKNIRAGDELTWNYNYSDKKCKCFCGSYNCTGFM